MDDPQLDGLLMDVFVAVVRVSKVLLGDIQDENGGVGRPAPCTRIPVCEWCLPRVPSRSACVRPDARRARAWSGAAPRR